MTSVHICPVCHVPVRIRCWECGWNVEKDSPKMDVVNNPQHYGQGSIESIEYIEDLLTTEEYIGFLRGNISKYLHRWRYKNGLEDLKKAQWYLNRLILVMEPTDEKTYDDPNGTVYVDHTGSLG